MPRLVVVLPLEPLHTGARFAVESWPLHITVVAPFLTDADPAVIGEMLAAATSTCPEFTVIAGEDELFGRKNTIPVTIIRDSEPLTSLRRKLVQALRPIAASPGEAAFTGAEFRAHVTMKNGRRVQVDDALTLTQLALVDMAPRADPSGRTVLATIDLGPASR
jgi:2'-5' RNA ligase